ncbi:GTPase IMAP family member 8-like isoform X1 [Conger conger]|uniref:GTPase IMAP family member 8-like isoform X1 n=1 Tax=Conger conger TaxID=82655 RepID=UPI002A59B0B3|nr:GTPase IMAP family member 8-like isoform X1 [Conger conger]
MASEGFLLEDDECRIILLGGRWGGKSSAGNTILGEHRFDSGRQRTATSDNRHGTVSGRKLVVVDTPGWKGYLSLRETTASDKEQIKQSVCKCLPGPHAFLLVIPLDSGFDEEHKRSLVDHLMLLGDRVWKYSMVLFTCGDWLREKTIEEHIKAEGASLQWLIEKCRNRFHVLSNKKKEDPTQVTQLLEKIDEMVAGNDGGHFEVDERTHQTMLKKNREVKAKAEERKLETDRRREQLRGLVQGREQPPELRVVLLGSRNAGKSASGNTILDRKEFDSKKGTSKSVEKHVHVEGTAITIVDTPGWWKSFSVRDTTKHGKQELKRSVSLCRPGPHVFLLVIDSDVAFTERHGEAVEEHLQLIGGPVWRHTMILFSRADWLGAKSIEQHIEGEGKALQGLVEKCGNRYHALDNKNKDNKAQVSELLQKIKEMVAGNGGSFHAVDEKALQSIEEGRKEVEENAKKRTTKVKEQRKRSQGTNYYLPEMRVVLMGQKSSGKNASGTTILGREEFPTTESVHCEEKVGWVLGRRLTVINTPGWCDNPAQCTLEQDKEIMKGLSLCPPGPHALLLVIPVDVAYTERHQRALQDHLRCLGEEVWRHTIVLFTYGDRLGTTALEEHIEREGWPLQWVVEKCGNRYHLFDNKSSGTSNQVAELLENIEAMVAGNDEEQFSPDMRQVHCEVENTFKRKATEEMKVSFREEMNRREQEFEEEWSRREKELIEKFEETLRATLEKDTGKRKHPACRLQTLSSKEGKVRKEQRQKQEITKIIEDVTAELGKRNWQDQQTPQMKTSQDNKPPQLGKGKVSQNSSSDFRFRMWTSIDLYPPSIGGSTGHMQTENSADRQHALRRMSWPFSTSSATSVGGGKVSQNSSSDFRCRMRTSIDLYPPSIGGSTGHLQTENSTDRLHALRRRKMWSPFISSATSIGQDSGIHSRLGSFSTSECQAERDASLPPGTGSR